MFEGSQQGCGRRVRQRVRRTESTGLEHGVRASGYAEEKARQSEDQQCDQSRHSIWYRHRPLAGPVEGVTAGLGPQVPPECRPSDGWKSLFRADDVGFCRLAINQGRRGEAVAQLQPCDASRGVLYQRALKPATRRSRLNS